MIAIVLIAGCGRWHFDERDDASVRDDVVVDSIAAIGCSDGTREGFTDRVAFPTIAGCAATWPGMPSVRAARTGTTSCGDGSAMCGVPADACAAGWHVCGDAGLPDDLTSRITAAQCDNAGTTNQVSFVAAMSHCDTCLNNCMAPATDCIITVPAACSASTLSCGEAVCCGTECANINSCKNGVFVGATKMGQQGAVCGALGASSQSGVLCCADQ